MKAGKNNPAKVKERNAALFARYLTGGMTYRTLAEEFEVSGQRAYQIIQREMSRRAGKSFAESGVLARDRHVRRHRRAVQRACEVTGLTRQQVGMVLRAYQRALQKAKHETA